MQSITIKMRVYEDIRKDIMDDVYNADSVLNEKTLIEKYQVSKSPIREALVLLCNEGFLKSLPRFGYMLTTFSPDESREIVQYRKIIELSALELSFAKLKKADIEELKAMNDELSDIVDTKNIKTHWDFNMQFHIKLCEYSANKHLIKALEDSLNICTIISNQYFVKRWNESRKTDGENHIKLVTAIEAKNLELAKEILAQDVEAFLQ